MFMTYCCSSPLLGSLPPLPLCGPYGMGWGQLHETLMQLTSVRRTWTWTVPTMDHTRSWLIPRSTAIGWLNEEDTMSSKHLCWGPFTSTFCEYCMKQPFLAFSLGVAEYVYVSCDLLLYPIGSFVECKELRYLTSICIRDITRFHQH